MNFFKPFFKKVLKLNGILINHQKLLKFRRKKWLKFVLQLKQWLMRYKFKLIDQCKFVLNFYANKLSSYANSFKLYFLFLRNIKYVYFNIKLKLSKFINTQLFLTYLEKRIDTFLVRAKFCMNLRLAKKLVTTNSVFVDNFKVIIKSFILSSGNFVKIVLNLNKFRSYLINSHKWHIPIDTIITNYSTKEFLTNDLYQTLTNKILYFPHNFNIKIISRSFYSLKGKAVSC